MLERSDKIGLNITWGSGVQLKSSIFSVKEVTSRLAHNQDRLLCQTDSQNQCQEVWCTTSDALHDR